MSGKNPFAEMMDIEAKRQKAEKTSSDKNKDLSKDLDKDSSKDAKIRTHTDVSKDDHQLPNADAVEEMIFHMRKAPMTRINGNVPEEWKEALDDYAHKAGVGKYHLVMYAIGKMLGKV